MCVVCQILTREYARELHIRLGARAWTIPHMHTHVHPKTTFAQVTMGSMSYF
jgi:diadenosine tetraphosphate (Ap4A) HIT family hydrolase